MLQKIKGFINKNRKILLILSVVLILVLSVFLITNKKEEPEFEVTQESTLSFYENYDIKLSDSVVEKLNVYEGEYDTFEVQVKDHQEWAENFAMELKGDNLKYRLQAYPALSNSDIHTLDQSLHYWEDESDFVFYNVADDFLFFSFENPSSVSGISFDFADLNSIENSLKDINDKFFSEDFNYVIDSIEREGNFYEIRFSRILNDIPIFSLGNELYLLVTPDGRLKEGRFLLAEFRNSTIKSTVSSGTDLLKNINNPVFEKSIFFEFLDLDRYNDFDMYFDIFDYVYEKADISISDGDLYYKYRDKFNKNITTQFLLYGGGFVEIDGEEIESSFDIIANSSL